MCKIKSKPTIENLTELKSIDPYVMICYDAMCQLRKAPNFISALETNENNILEDEDELTKIYERNYIISLSYKVGLINEDFNCLVNGETLKIIDTKTTKEITDAYKKLKGINPETHIDKIQCFPDFIFHESNNPNSIKIENQHLILEAKTSKNLSSKDFCKDFFKLNLYIEKLNFRNAVYLLINTRKSQVKKFINDYIKEYNFISTAEGNIYFLIQEKISEEVMIYIFDKEKNVRKI